MIKHYPRLIPEKGAQFLICAAREVVKAIPESSIVIASDGWFRSTLQDLARKEGVSERVKFIGKVPADLLVSCYFAADLLAYPVISAETFSLVPLEAFACGTAVCASDAVGTPEILVHGSTGYLHRAGNAEDLANSFIAALFDDKMRNEIATQARDFVSTHHTVERLGPKYEAVYKSL